MQNFPDQNRLKKSVVFCYNTAAYLIRFRKELIAEFQSAGFECHAALPHIAISASELAELEVLGIQVHRMHRFEDQRVSARHDLLLLQEYFRLFSRIQPELVFSFTIKPAIYATIAARLSSAKRAAVMITGLGYIFTGNSARQVLLSFIVRVMYLMALRSKGVLVFFQNTDDLSYFRKWHLVRKQSARLVNGSGVDLTAYAPTYLPDGPPVFLMVARLLRDKGIYEYLEACTLVKARLPEAKFLLAGGLDNNPSCIAPLELQPYIDSGVVEYLGYVSDPRIALRRATIYVLPSYREGRPRTVLEAMACGLPVISTNVPGCRETVVPGMNGYLVPARDAVSLADAMFELGENSEIARRMGKESRRLAEEKYDVRTISSNICAETLSFVQR